jgi:predicted AAA+ superfamily ATPase
MVKHGPTWEPKLEDFQQVLLEQNPWSLQGKVPDALAQAVERPLATHLWAKLKANDPPRYQVILGPRRVGKSTAMYQTVRRLINDGIKWHKIWWLRVDHPLLMTMQLGPLVKSIMKSAEASEQSPAYLFLDEITYARSWDLWLKTFYDERWPIRLVGSSSATAALREGRLESGAGRWEEQYLPPYLFTEFLSLIGHKLPIPVRDTLAETIDACISARLDLTDLQHQRRRFLLTGGFPELLIAEGQKPAADEASMLLQSQRTLRTDAVERALYKDIPQAFGVGDPLMLERVLYTLAGQVTGVLSPQSICQDLDGLSQPTFDKYLSYFERAFLVFALSNYSGSEASKQKRGRKLYFVDGAVRNAALQRGIAPLSDPHEMGILMENMVAGHLHALSQQSQIRMYHWRDGGQEVDLVYDHPTIPAAFEIASSTSHHMEGLKAFIQRFPKFSGRCFLVAPNAPAAAPSSRSNGIGTLPLDLLLLAIGAQTQKEIALRLGVLSAQSSLF